MDQSFMKIGIIGYVPPPTYPGAQSFLANMQKFKSKHETFFYSDHVPYGFHYLRPPEGTSSHAIRENQKWAINNAIFSAGIRLAVMCKFTHIIYMESDCRVWGDGWDDKIFTEYFDLPFPAIAAGSLVSHSCVNGGHVFYERFSDMIGRNRREKREHLIPIYGIPNPPPEGKFPDPSQNIIKPGQAVGNKEVERFKPAVYPNGALGVYSVAWLAELFGIDGGTGKFKPEKSNMDIMLGWAWDHMIGIRLYDRFGPEIFDVVAHMNTVFSSFGNRLSTEASRLQLLRDGKAVAVHQVKGEVQP
jgi:hypothetical protein